MPNIFDFSSYRPYVIEALGGEARRSGQRSKAAQALGCHLAYLSQILRGDADFSVEQAFALAEHLELTADERTMLLLLVQKERAGRVDLKQYFQEQIDALLSQRNLLKNRLGPVGSLDSEDAAVYYGSWLHCFLHMAVSVPTLKTREALVDRLALPANQVTQALEFLESRGLIVRDDQGLYQVGPRHIHLPDSSPNILKHHANWRLKALQSLERPIRPSEIHYAVVFSLSKADALKIREQTLKLIEDTMATVKASPEETVYCSVVDWFEVP